VTPKVMRSWVGRGNCSTGELAKGGQTKLGSLQAQENQHLSVRKSPREERSTKNIGKGDEKGKTPRSEEATTKKKNKRKQRGAYLRDGKAP